MDWPKVSTIHHFYIILEFKEAMNNKLDYYFKLLSQLDCKKQVDQIVVTSVIETMNEDIDSTTVCKDDKNGKNCTTVRQKKSYQIVRNSA